MFLLCFVSEKTTWIGHRACKSKAFIIAKKNGWILKFELISVSPFFVFTRHVRESSLLVMFYVRMVHCRWTKEIYIKQNLIFLDPIVFFGAGSSSLEWRLLLRGTEQICKFFLVPTCVVILLLFHRKAFTGPRLPKLLSFLSVHSIVYPACYYWEKRLL